MPLKARMSRGNFNEDLMSSGRWNLTFSDSAGTISPLPGNGTIGFIVIDYSAASGGTVKLYLNRFGTTANPAGSFTNGLRVLFVPLNIITTTGLSIISTGDAVYTVGLRQ